MKAAGSRTGPTERPMKRDYCKDRTKNGGKLMLSIVAGPFESCLSDDYHPPWR